MPNPLQFPIDAIRDIGGGLQNNSGSFTPSPGFTAAYISSLGEAKIVYGVGIGVFNNVPGEEAPRLGPIYEYRLP